MRGQFRSRAVAMALGLVLAAAAPMAAAAAPAASDPGGWPGGVAWPGNQVGAAWGLNSFGQLGDTTWKDRTSPVGVYELSDVAKIAAGHNHSLAVMADGTLRTWGANGSAQLGYGWWLHSTYPRAVPGLRTVVDAAGGWTHSVAAMADGTVWAWGDNKFGQLGDGTTDQRFSPIRVVGMTGAIAVAAGNGWSLALTSDGSVWAWGLNGSGILGTAAAGSQSVTPVRVEGLADVVAIAAGSQHAMAIATGASGGVRSVWTWGQNAVGQLGVGPCQGIICGSAIPFRVKGLPSIASIAAGALTSVALSADGSVWTWGAGLFGALGGGGKDAVRFEPGVAVPAGIVGIAAGGYHVVAIRAGGTVIAWGSNSYGELGDGTTATESGTVDVDYLTDVTQVAAGDHHTLALYTRAVISDPRRHVMLAE